METHLNLAHRSHRKAEHYKKCHQKFTEAIFHYNKAAEYFENCIQKTSCDTIRSSLLVQREYCLDQIEFLKQRLLDKIQKDITRYNNAEKQRKPVSPLKLLITSRSTKMSEPPGSALETIDQQKNLLEKLSVVICDNASPKEDQDDDAKAIVSEMKTLNEKLRQMFGDLVGRFKKSQTENETLKQENAALRKEISVLKNKLKISELPPLQPPTLLY